MRQQQKLHDFFERWRDKTVLIQGLGLNGGGIASARFFLEAGIPVIITDMQNSDVLAPSVTELEPYTDLITYRLGGHHEDDFITADLVVHSPAVRPGTKFLAIAEEHGAEITSDISIFLSLCPAVVVAVTGSKGKSTTVSVLYHMLLQRESNCYLGGNITISPLTFLADLDENSIVVLELSSWQLRDLPDTGWPFAVAAITNLMNDHQNYYTRMDDYLADKIRIAYGMEPGSLLLIPENSEYIQADRLDTEATILKFNVNGDSADLFYTDGKCVFRMEGAEEVLFEKGDIPLRGEHSTINMMIAAGLARCAGLETEFIKQGVKTFPGVPFRMEPVRTLNSVTWVNDTTATMPDAAVCAVKSYDVPVIWIGGGSDKNCDFSVLKEISTIPKHILLLSGDATDSMVNILKRDDIVISESLEELVSQAAALVEPGMVVLFSPGATSFGHFTNEFHRGRVFNELVAGLK